MFLCRAFIWPSVLLFTTLTCCKIAGYDDPFDPWAQLYAGLKEVYQPEDATGEGAIADAEGEQTDPTAKSSTQALQAPLATVASEDFNTPALDAVLQEMGEDGGSI